MLKNIILSVFILVSVSAWGFDKEQCKVVSANVGQAQAVLNEDKNMFDMTVAIVDASPPSRFEWTEEMKTYIQALVKKLIEGGNPQAAANAAYAGCMAGAKTI